METISSNTLKRSYTMIKWDSFQGCKDGTIFAITHTMSYITQTKWSIKITWSYQYKVKKHLKKNSALIYVKNTQQSRNTGSITQHNKGHIWETYCQYHTQWAKTKMFPLKIRCLLWPLVFNVVLEVLATVIRQERNKRHPNGKGGSKTVTVHTQHESVHRKPYNLHQKLLKNYSI